MRIVRFRLVLLLLGLAFLAPGSVTAGPKPGRGHVDYRHGYRIVIPKDWGRVPPGPRDSVEIGKWYGKTTGWGSPPPRMEVVLVKTQRTEITKATGEEEAEVEELSLEEQLRRRFTGRQAPTSAHDWYKSQLEAWKFRGGEVTFDETKDAKISKTDAQVHFGTVDLKRIKLKSLLAVVPRAGEEFGILIEEEADEFDKNLRFYLGLLKSFKFVEVKSEREVDYDEALESLRIDRDDEEQRRWVQKIAEAIDDVAEWDYVATENYLVLHDREVDPRDVKKVAVQIEAIRKDVYESLFPPEKEIKAISVVRICKDRQQYGQYGGPGGSAGYWSPSEKELVFFFDGKDAIRVLYHEAFHQYIFYAFGAFSPHIWFNEGHGDFFSGFDYKGRFVPGRFEWRRGIIKNAIAQETFVPLEKFLHYTQQQYYANASLCYAQGWSFIWFLRNTRNEAYRKILPRYFDVLKRELGGTEIEGAPEGFRDPARTKAALDKALEEAFDGIDLSQLEHDWKTYGKY